MLRNALVAIVCLLWASASGSFAQSTGAARVDKAKLEQFIRYTEGYTAMVKVTVGDPEPSPFKGLDRLPVHLSLGEQKIDKFYYVSADGQIVNGTVWNLNQSPYSETFEHLPRTGPSFGPANAKVTIVVFSDFQCPYCRQFAKTIREQIPKKYPNDVRIEFQDFPIASIHKWAQAAAEASHCVGEGNNEAFWKFHDWIFEHQEEITAGNVKDKSMEFAKTIGVDPAKVGACIDGHAGAGPVKAGLQAGQELSVQQTPTSFVNGRMVSGALKAEDLATIIQLELSRPASVPGPPAPKSTDGKPLRP
jgi:predicted DsbA family dithiol-disulfide isomerase